MQNTTTKNDMSRFDHFLYCLPERQLRRKVTNRVVTYYNESPSSVKNDGVRNFMIKTIDCIGNSRSSGRRYIQGEVQDLNDGGKTKPRTLHIAGITKVENPFVTVIKFFLTLFMPKFLKRMLMPKFLKRMFMPKSVY